MGLIYCQSRLQALSRKALTVVLGFLAIGRSVGGKSATESSYGSTLGSEAIVGTTGLALGRPRLAGTVDYRIQ